MCGAILGGVIGDSFAYIKYLKKVPRSMRGGARRSDESPPPALVPTVIDTGATHDHIPEGFVPPPAPRRIRGVEIAPGSRMPEQIVITKTGLEDTHIFHREGCHVTRAGVANNSNVTFRKCDICF
jgi:hypothetical protein